MPKRPAKIFPACLILSVFGKYYDQFVAGPIATTTNQDKYVRTTRSINSMGYGAAGTYFILSGLQVKVSYEKAYRLPTIEEMFGDEDLEMGDIGIKPESSDNLNLNLSYNKTFGKHSVCRYLYQLWQSIDKRI